MIFSSISFLLFFLPMLLFFYFIVPKKFRELRNIVLLLFSFVFYSYGGPKFILLMVLSILINYMGGILVGRKVSRRIKKIYIIFFIMLNILVLIYFKYTGFFLEIINSLSFNISIPNIVLPIGISFYTFQGISYIIDVYRKEAKVQRNILRLALYISLFPQLVAGPIVRYTTIENEISKRNENIKGFSSGLIRFMFGFSKKMIIANIMGEIVDEIFLMDINNMSFLTSWIGAIAYTAQIYFDFSAYSDMAIGLGKMFGFHFLENFNYPYISKSVTEFWRRWHISLSTWFRDYVYIPLGGNRDGKLKYIRNIIIVWFLTGMWHGASWNFILWGIWFCIFLLCEKFLWGNFLSKSNNFIKHIYTMFVVIISWVLFRCETLTQVIDYISVMFGFNYNQLISNDSIYYLIQYKFEFFIAFIFSMPIYNIFKEVFLRNRRIRKNNFFKFLYIWIPPIFSFVLFIFSYMKLVTGSFNPFIYFRF